MVCEAVCFTLTPMTTRQISFAVLGLRGACAKSAVEIERALSQIDGVVAAHVNYATERATVIYDPTRVAVHRFLVDVRAIGFDAPLERVTIWVEDLPYATSARTVEQALGQIAGVANVKANLADRYIALEAFPEHVPLTEIKDILCRLGLHAALELSPNAVRNFGTRSLVILVLASLVIWSAGAHAGFWSAGVFHSPPVVMTLAAFIFFGVGWRFFAIALDVALQGRFDSGVLIALGALMLALISLPLGLMTPNSWLVDFGFVAAAVLTAGWFLWRAATLWVMPRLRSTHQYRPLVISISVVALGAVTMAGIYLGILTVAMDFAFALQQAGRDGLWLGSIALAFGAQLGMYVYLRLVFATAKAVGATMMAGSGTGTSTLGMLACCAHHLTDVAPLVVLTGASSLSSAIAYLSDWKYAFIALGLAMNVMSIGVTVRTIRKSMVRLEIVSAK